MRQFVDQPLSSQALEHGICGKAPRKGLTTIGTVWMNGSFRFATIVLIEVS